MKVTLTTDKEINAFRHLVGDMCYCDKCDNVQPIEDIEPVIWCLTTKLGYGYVEVVCPKCGGVQVIIPVYSAFPSCIAAFDNAATDPSNDKIYSKLGPTAVDNLRRSVSIHRKEGSPNVKKSKYRTFL